MQQFQNRVVAWLCSRRQRLIEAFTPQTSVFRQLCHTARLRHISYSSKKHFWIRIIQRSSQIFRNHLLVVEIIGGIKFSKSGHGSYSLSRTFKICLERLMSRCWVDLSPPSDNQYTTAP